MANEDEYGSFQEFPCALNSRGRGRHGQQFHHGHKFGGEGLFSRQRRRGRGFFNRQSGRGRGFCSSYGDHREKFCQIGGNEGFWPNSNVEEANGHFSNMDPQPQYNNEGFVLKRNAQFPHERTRGRGRGRQNPSNGFHGHGRWNSNNGHRGCIGNSFCHHGLSYEDAENSQSFGNNSRPYPDHSWKQGKWKTLVHSHGKMVGRGGAFRGNFKSKGANFGNKGLAPCVNRNIITANASSSVDLQANMHDECEGAGIGLKTSSTGSLPATNIVGSIPSTKKKLRKQKAPTLIRRLLDAKRASQSQAPLNSEPEKEVTLLQEGDANVNIDRKHQEEKEGTCRQEEDVTINMDQRDQESELKEEDIIPREEDATMSVDQRHQERGFISCIGGSNRKRRRSIAVRDFPVVCGSLKISAVKKVKIISKESKAAAVVEKAIGEVGSLSKLEVMNENSSNLNISGVYVELAQGDPKDESGDCSRTHVTERDGFVELVQSGSEFTTENASKTALSEGDASAELVPASTEADINSITTLSKESGYADTVQASFEGNCENCSNPVLVEKDNLSEPVQAGPEGNTEEHTKMTETDTDHSIEFVQSDLQVSNQEWNAKVETARQISCNGHGPSQSASLLAFESSQVKVPQVPAVATSMHMHTSSQGISHPSVKKKKKKTLVNQKEEIQTSEVHLKKKGHHSKLDKLPTGLTDTSTELHSQGNVSKKLKVPDFSEITESSGAFVPYKNSKSGASVKNKEPGRRLIHKGRTRVKHCQTSKSLDNLMHSDPTKGSCLEATEGASDRSLVKRTLHEFESARKALVKSQNAVRRADLDAASLLKERGKWRNCEAKIVGEVPGVEVGDQFSFRMEMLIIGLHRQVQSGIDYIPGTKRSNGTPLATSIVASGGYEHDKDDGNTLIYSGQGGNNSKGNKKQESNQELVRGNLALSNSMKEGMPVRVIRGTPDLTSPSSKIYTYDGLYDVINFIFERGATGYGVYHFTLARRAGQPQVGLSFLSNLKKKGLARPYLLIDDISRGQERLPICVVNEVDEELGPLNFTYIPKIKHPMWYSPLLPQGCNCVGVCDEETCSCAVKNGNELPYNEKGYIIRDKKVVYECGISCSCSSSCQNRVSQKGLRYRLEIFKTINRGWGVRSIDPIQPGGFICEYTGELLTDAEAEQRIENDEYLFDLGNECNPSSDQLNLVKMDESVSIDPPTEDVAYTIDAKDLGNVARFINHSCSPNLYAQNVLYDSDDLRFPHVMLFAMENIPPMRELTYDYNYNLDQVHDAFGKVKIKACYCGAQDCQGRLY